LATLIIPQEPVDPTLVTFIDEKVKAIFTGKQLLTHLPFTWGAYASVNIGQMGANT
jgi:hypothetical protein